MPSPEELYAGGNFPPEIAQSGEGKFYDVYEEPEQDQVPKVEAPVSPVLPASEADDEDEDDEDVLAQFDPRWTDEMEGLLFVGRVTHEFNLGGHRITIATPEAQDSLRAALLIKEYQESAGALRALTLAALAACLIKVDGHVLPRGIMADGSDDLEARFNWVSKLHTSVIDGIYQEYEALEIKVNAAIVSLGKGAVPERVLSVLG
jgi:hypothetical protein